MILKIPTIPFRTVGIFLPVTRLEITVQPEANYAAVGYWDALNAQLRFCNKKINLEYSKIVYLFMLN